MWRDDVCGHQQQAASREENQEHVADTWGKSSHTATVLSKIFCQLQLILVVLD
jgi:hypothetical protein